MEETSASSVLTNGTEAIPAKHHKSSGTCASAYFTNLLNLLLNFILFLILYKKILWPCGLLRLCFTFFISSAKFSWAVSYINFRPII